MGLPPQPVATPVSAPGVLPKPPGAAAPPEPDPHADADVPPSGVLPQEFVVVEPKPDVEDRPGDEVNALVFPPVAADLAAAAALSAACFCAANIAS